MILLFREWLLAVESDDGLQAFIDSQNWSFKDFLRKLLEARRITDPRLVQEADALIADHSNSLFNYGEELLKIALGGRGRLAGGDTLQAATEAAGRLWEKLWRPEAFAGTWESRFPGSVSRGGIVGTVRAFANNLIGHFVQRLRKSRAGVSTFQQSQVYQRDNPFDVAAGASNQPGEWEEWKTAILRELINDLRSEEEKNQGGKHWQARVRNLRWAIAIAEKQMVVPYEWRSMPEVMAEIPELQGIRRGGLQQTLKALIDDARNRVVAKMGSDREQTVAQRLQTRGRQRLQPTQVDRPRGPAGKGAWSYDHGLAANDGPAEHADGPADSARRLVEAPIQATNRASQTGNAVASLPTPWPSAP